MATPESMALPNDYFANHQRVRRFPWSLYHGPLEADLERFLGSLPKDREVNVLVIGCGLIQELDKAPAQLRFTAVDIDERAVSASAASGDSRLVQARLVAPDEDLSRLGRFDAAYASFQVLTSTPVLNRYICTLFDADGIVRQKINSNFHVCRISDFEDVST